MSRRPKASLTWRHLPSDKSINQVCAEYEKNTKRDRRPSASWVKNVLSELDVETRTESIYYALYKQNIEKGFRNTAMKSISWEVEALIYAVFQVRDKSMRGREITARQVLEHMADELVNGFADDAADQYKDPFIRHTMFENVGIQQVLLHSFRPLFKKRLDRFERYLFDSEAQIDIEKLKRTLEQLDALLYEFRRVQPHGRPDDTQQLNTLYHKLNAPRKELLKRTKKDEAKAADYCWSPLGDEDLIEALKTQVSNTSRFPEQSEVDAFLKNYRKYLETTALPEVKVSAFERKYQELHQYFYGNTSVEQFRKDITAELYMFARSIFEDLRRMDTIEISWTGYQQQNAASAYARNVLAEVHRDIQMIIHAPLIPLRISYSYGYINGFSKGCTRCENERIEKVCAAMEYHIQALSEKYPILKNKNWEQKYEAYQTYAVPIYKDDITPEKVAHQIYYEVTLPETAPAKRMYGLGELLRMTCQLVVAIEVEKAIDRLTREYAEILGLLPEPKTEQAEISKTEERR